MRHLYAYAIVAIHRSDTRERTAVRTDFTVGMLYAISEKEAEGIAYGICKDRYPPVDGYTGHSVTVLDLNSTVPLETRIEMAATLTKEV